jgi:predicted ATPase/serine/threonine protein kinase/GAF domain-containing protein
MIAGRFSLGDLIGKGGTGRVYAARDLTTGRRVAVKLLEDGGLNATERFAREADLLATITHPAIVRYLAHGAEGSQLWLAMDWLDGESLAQRLARGALSVCDAAQVVERVAGGLAALHAQGVVHRDVKPHNILLVGNEPIGAVLLDLGIARDPSSETLTAIGTVIGTAGYMAPEQASGEFKADTRADLFSLGCVLFECLTGRRTFTGETPAAVLAKILLAPAPLVSDLRPDVPAPLDRLVARMLSKDPAKRPTDAHEVAAELQSLRAAYAEPPAFRLALGDIDLGAAKSKQASASGSAALAYAHEVVVGYQVTEKLYESDQTVVYRTLPKSGQQRVILKILKREYPTGEERSRYRHEYEITRSLRGSHTINVCGLERFRGTLVLVVEDFGGESLDSLMRRREMSLDEFFTVALHTVEGLAQIHAAGVIHKDINPANIVWDAETGRLKIIDFGIATRLSRELRTCQRHVSLLEGTLAYISPEQTGRVGRDIDYRSDFYSLGATFYELLTRKKPFPTHDVVGLVHSHIAKAPVPPHEINPEIPTVLSDIVLKLMAKNAEDRYQSASGIAADLSVCRERRREGRPLTTIALGQKDISERLEVPQKLYGRDREVQEMLAAFDRVSGGATEMVLVKGYSGIGKSSLIQQVQRPILRQRGYFVSSKFDQYRRDVPYGSIVQSFNLVEQLLFESEERIAVWRSRLCAAMGDNAHLLIDFIPELEILVGKQRPTLNLNRTEAQERFNVLFTRLVAVFAELGHPLVIFFDDLQWADQASLSLIKTLLTDAQTRSLMVIGAYRDNEVPGTHPLIAAIEDIRQAQVAPVHALTLNPLKSDDIHRLVTETVKRPEAVTLPLAWLLEQKTHGNPFFLNQMLGDLHEKGLLRFDSGSGMWSWDLAKIERAEITSNVVDLMAAKIKRLSAPTQRILKLAACSGSRFDIALLAVMSEQYPAAVAVDLLEALKEGLIVPIDSYETPELHTGEEDATATPYRFLHDRVQQSAWSLVPENERAAVRLKVGRLLLRKLSREALEARIFDVLDHLAEGMAQIADGEERIAIARVALAAGRQAKASVAYQAAARYLAMGMDLLPDDGWEAEYDLALDLTRERAHCEYSIENFAMAEQLCETIVSHARSRSDRVGAYDIWINLDLSRGAVQRAVERAIECLHMFDIELSLHPTWEEVVAQYDEINELLRKRSIEDLANLPRMTDPDMRAAMDVLALLLAPAFRSDPNLFYLHFMHMVKLSLHYGNSDASVYAYGGFGLPLARRFGRPHDAFRFGQLSLRLIEQGIGLQHRPIALFFMELISYWSQPIATMIEYVERAFEAAVQSGTGLNLAGACCTHLVADLIERGDPVDEVQEVIERRLDFIQKANQRGSYDLALGMRQYVKNMRGLTRSFSTFDDDLFDQEKFEAGLTPDRMRQLVAWYHVVKLMARYASEDYQVALEAVEKVKPLLWACGEHVQLHDYTFYYALTLAAVHRDASPEEQERSFATLQQLHAELRVWADRHPANFLHSALLVSAEITRLEGKTSVAADLYDKAIETSLAHGFIHHAAVAAECAGRFYIESQKPTRARAYLTEAHYNYLQWGAEGKARQLIEKYADLIMVGDGTGNHFVTDTQAAKHDAIDLVTVIRALQAISSEIILDRLLPTLLRVAFRNAGAERGALLIEKGGIPQVVAEGAIAQETIYREKAIPLDRWNGGLRAAVEYVHRTREWIVLGDATRDARFCEDVYVRANRLRSVLCVPLFRQERQVAILYLENRLAADAFDSRRIDVLKMLAGQMAVSLENAQLLAREVEARAAAEDAAGRRDETASVTVERAIAPDALAGLRIDRD